MKKQPVKGARFIAKRVIEGGDFALATVTEVSPNMNTVHWVTDGGRSFSSDLKTLSKNRTRKSFAFEVKEWIEA